ncbi:uncharacterized protein ABDE67_000821 [Symphorus nematophorus]
MFPSAGLFADINCPFSKRGLCERPHCLYKHVTELFGASYQSSVESAGQCSPVNNETKEDCLQELERINKQIETVRHEVEQEQRRLSCYRTVQVDSRNTKPNFTVSKSETAGTNVERGSYGLSSCTNSTKTYSRARKYVVDSSKPRTDLEYDPLSNFSSDLRSYGSSTKEQKVKTEQDLKRARNAVLCDQKKLVTCQALLSQLPSPEPIDDSNEDGVLIIDIPPSPDKKRPVDSVAGKKFENVTVDGHLVDLTGCSKDLERESQKITPFQAAETIVAKSPEPASPPSTTNQQDQNGNSLVVEKEESKFQCCSTARKQQAKFQDRCSLKLLLAILNLRATWSQQNQLQAVAIVGLRTSHQHQV